MTKTCVLRLRHNNVAAHQDFPGSPVAGTLSSSAEGVGSIPGRGS